MSGGGGDYDRQLEAARNVISQLFEKAGPVVWCEPDGSSVDLECLDGKLRLWQTGNRWFMAVEDVVQHAGNYWAEATKHFADALCRYMVVDLLVDEEQQMKSEEELGENG